MNATLPSIAASPLWATALPPGPDTRVKITAEYARLVGSDAYFWAWPMVNVFNRRQFFATVGSAPNYCRRYRPAARHAPAGGRFDQPRRVPVRGADHGGRLAMAEQHIT